MIAKGSCFNIALPVSHLPVSSKKRLMWNMFKFIRISRLKLMSDLSELNGEQIGVESEMGKGSCFTITLPSLPKQLASISNLI